MPGMAIRNWFVRLMPADMSEFYGEDFARAHPLAECGAKAVRAALGFASSESEAIGSRQNNSTSPVFELSPSTAPCAISVAWLRTWLRPCSLA